MELLKGILIVISTSLGGGLIGFIGPLLLSMILEDNPAWSFVPIVAIPIGVGIGFIVGLFYAFR